MNEPLSIISSRQCKHRTTPLSLPSSRRTPSDGSATIAVPAFMLHGLPRRVMFVLALLSSFWLGTLWQSYSSSKETSSQSCSCNFRQVVFQPQPLPQCHCETLPSSNSLQSTIAKNNPPDAKHSEIPKSLESVFVAMARTSKQEFTNRIDLGVPIDLRPHGNRSGEEEDFENEDMLILYGNKKAMPNRFTSLNHEKDTIPSFHVAEALENCQTMNVVLTQNSNRNQCLVLVPQYESYYIQKWMRIDARTSQWNPNAPLQLVASTHRPNGQIDSIPPDLQTDTNVFWSILSQYLANVQIVLQELRPLLHSIVDPVQHRNTVIVMIGNFGQSELLLNFICSARRRHLDLSNLLVFATDKETMELVTALGVTVYYDHRNFDSFPSAAAKEYGDSNFVAMMMAKVISVQLVSMLGYNILFQDLDVIWYRHPLDYFYPYLDEGTQQYDIFFQDDGGRSVRYAPYSANSGFYFIRHNARTRHLLTSVLMMGDRIIRSHSHQQVLISLLNEHVTLFGLKVKVLSRDAVEFPGGYHYHQRSKAYMKDLFAGKAKPFIFHMSWTLNKLNKILFFRQMGEWFVREHCVQTKVGEIDIVDSLSTFCCANEPILSCHYRDKPSIQPCSRSPPLDKNQPSWW